MLTFDPEVEEEVDSEVGYECLEDPTRLRKVNSRVAKRAREEFGVERFSEVGRFQEYRMRKWEKVKGMIEGLLKENGIEFSYSQVSKFMTFRSGKLPQ
ncbi:hypothetical protein ACH5RR_005790 [Cinchona calisaya]|uniref:Uncharacterized protein n=1 Tax=Cinchona calisaya TaxID=153742 RepID=A0ABD3AM65_9GENT